MCFALLLALQPIRALSQALYNNGATIEVGSEATVYITGDLSNQSGLLNSNGQLEVKGNIVNDQIFNSFTGGSLALTGSALQTISGSSPLLVKHLNINNSEGVALDNSVSIDGTLTFTNGRLTAITAPLLLTANASYSGVSDASHVVGYVRRQGNGHFTFPVGDGTRHQPVDVNLTSNSEGINVRYFGADAGASDFLTTGSSSIPLEAYNTQEYWDITPVGTASGTVTLSWDDYRNPALTTSSHLNVFKVAHKTAAGWVNEGSEGLTGTFPAGSVTSEVVNTWSPFALGVINESVFPVKLIRFTARQIENDAALSWQTTNEVNASHFEIERSSDALNFLKIGSVEAAGNGSEVKEYRFNDGQFGRMEKSAYYRLRSVDRDGSFSLSGIISLTTSGRPSTVSVYPNPALRHFPVTLETNSDFTELNLFNSSGISVPLSVTNLANGKARINTSRLSSGTYILQVKTDLGITNKKLIID